MTGWLSALRHDDSRAATAIWERFHHQTLALAARVLGTLPRRWFDEEDVVSEAFRRLFEVLRRGPNPPGNREEAARLLAVIVRHVALNHHRTQQTLKRGGGEVRGESAFGSSGPGIAAVVDDDQTPDDRALDSEQQARLLSLLPPALREFAELKLHGLTHLEISEQMQCSLTTVERKFRLIRATWRQRGAI